MAQDDNQNNSPFMGGLTDSDPEQFSERLRYSAYSDNYALGTPLLDTIEKRRLYGFIDKDYYPIEPNAEILPTTGQPIGVKTFGEYAPEVWGLTFVVDAFTEFRNYYMNLMRTNGLTLPDEISSMVPTRSLNEVDTSLLQYERQLSLKINQYILSDQNVDTSSHPLNLRDYINSASDAMFDRSMNGYTITKSGFLVSQNSTVYNTGLYIDLFAGGNPEIDVDKQRILEYDGFKCFVEKAWEYGFYVDKNCPWRLVLNLDSIKIKKNIMFSGGENPTRELLRFDDFYSNQKVIRTGLDDFWILREFMRKAFYDYRLQLSQSQETEERLTDVYINTEMDQISNDTWIEHLIKYRLRELGYLKKADLDTSQQQYEQSSRYQLYREIFNEAKMRMHLREPASNPQMPGMQLYGLEGTSGALKYIEFRCADIIRHELEKAKSKNYNNRHNSSGYLSEVTIDLTDP